MTFVLNLVWNVKTLNFCPIYPYGTLCGRVTFRQWAMFSRSFARLHTHPRTFRNYKMRIMCHAFAIKNNSILGALLGAPVHLLFPYPRVRVGRLELCLGDIKTVSQQLVVYGYKRARSSSNSSIPWSCCSFDCLPGSWFIKVMRYFEGFREIPKYHRSDYSIFRIYVKDYGINWVCIVICNL